MNARSSFSGSWIAEPREMSDQELIHILRGCVEGFDKASRAKRDRLTRAFKEKSFPAGHVLFKEGEILTCAYIIVEGECLMQSQKNPLYSNITFDGEIQTQVNNQFITNKGFMSKTTNSFKIGILTKGAWIGQDIVQNTPETESVSYSVVAQTNVKLLQISKQDMLLKMPKEFKKGLEESFQERKKWQIVRLLDIKRINKKIYKKDENVDAYREAMENVQQLHSTATKIAQNNFRNKFLTVTSPININIKHSKSYSQTIVDNYTLRKRIKWEDKTQVDDAPIRNRLNQELLEISAQQEKQANAAETSIYITEKIEIPINKPAVRGKTAMSQNPNTKKNPQFTLETYKNYYKNCIKNQYPNQNSAIVSTRSSLSSFRSKPKSKIFNFKGQQVVVSGLGQIESIDNSQQNLSSSFLQFSSQNFQPRCPTAFTSRKTHSSFFRQQASAPVSPLRQRHMIKQQNVSIDNIIQGDCSSSKDAAEYRKVYMDHAFSIKNRQNMAKKYYMPIFKIKEQMKVEKILAFDNNVVQQQDRDISPLNIQQKNIPIQLEKSSFVVAGKRIHLL